MENISPAMQGIIVMIIGFSTVFVFLTILIFAMHIQRAVVSYLNKIFPVAAPQAAASKASKTVRGGDDEVIAVAIAAACLKENFG